MHRRTKDLLRPAAAFAFAFGLAGCGVDDPLPQPVASLYVAPASLEELSGATFFDHPWPSDLRLEGGSPRTLGFPNPRQVPVLGQYIEATQGLLDGFSPAAAGFVRFAGPIDVSSLPATPKDGLLASASVQLIDIDPASPEHGERRLVSLYFRRDEGVYWPANTLAFMPTLGFPLRPHTRYAFVVTDALRSESFGLVVPSAELRQVLGLDGASGPAAAAAKDALAPALAELAAAGVEKEHIAHLAIFTTNDPTAELFAVRDHLLENVPAPKLRGPVELHRKRDDYNEFVGSYGPSPNYQAGKIPFAKFGDGGGFQVIGGEPQMVDMFYMRFSISVPREDLCPMPEAGYPIVLYAHGTGGDYRSYARDGTALALAKACVATMGVDQIFHGERPGAPIDQDDATISLLFFNAQNMIAARTNGRQGAIDEVQRARLFTESSVKIPKEVTPEGREARFDGSKLMYFGHSQGGLNGPLYMAADSSALGGVLSGASAVMSVTLIEKTKPAPSIAELVQLIFLSLNAEEAPEVSEFHPAISLAQMIVDVVDPIHYARNIALEPRSGQAPKSVYMTEGINPDGVGDSYAPPHGIEAHAIAMGLPLQMPAQRPILELEWGGPAAVTVPAGGLTGNMAGGAATGVLAQWPVAPKSDGHFVIFNSEAARAQSTAFLKSLAGGRPGTIPPP
jgi:hypothetical protein